jgi:hypothetical protein
MRWFADSRARTATLAALALLWVVSLWLPALSAGGSRFTGFDVLLQGWRGTRAAVLAWYANPLFVFACLLLARRAAVAASVCAALAVALSLTTFVARDIAAALDVAVPPFRVQIGFYFWIAAQCGVLLVAVASKRAVMERTPNPE